MAVVIRAYVLVLCDDEAEAEATVYSVLNGAAFESSSTIVDVATGIEQFMPMPDEYEDGSFLQKVPSAALLQTINSRSLPVAPESPVQLRLIA